MHTQFAHVTHLMAMAMWNEWQWGTLNAKLTVCQASLLKSFNELAKLPYGKCWKSGRSAFPQSKVRTSSLCQDALIYVLQTSRAEENDMNLHLWIAFYMTALSEIEYLCAHKHAYTRGANNSNCGWEMVEHMLVHSDIDIVECICTISYISKVL